MKHMQARNGSMRSWARIACLGLWLFAGWHAALQAVESFSLPIRMEEVAGLDRSSWPIRGGIPFPKGKFAAGAEKKLQLLDPSGKAVPMIAKVAAKWNDGSTKWLWIDAQADVKASNPNMFTLKTGAAVGPKQPIKVTDAAQAISVETGVLQFSILKALPGGLGKIVVNGKVFSEKGLPDAMVVDYQTKGPALNSLARRGSYKRNEPTGAKSLRLLASTGKEYKASVEISTPLRVVVRTEGWYGAAGKTACRFVVRYTAYAGQPYIKIHHTIIFTEDPMNFLVRRIGYRIPFGKATSFRTGGAEEAVVGASQALAPGQSASLLSIGPDINHNGIKIENGPQKDVTFEVFTFTGDGNSAAQRKSVAKGKHALGYMTVLGEGKGCTLSLRNFWKQHPNELSYNAKDGALECWVWANHGGKVIDMRNPKYNMKIRGEHRIGGKATGTAKTHEILLNFHAEKNAEAAGNIARMHDHPIWPFVTPEWNCATDVIPLTAPYEPDRFPGMEKNIEILYAWVRANQKDLHWDGFFGYGGVLIEFDNHSQRYSRGSRGTWCWLDYAGFLNEDGQQSHHFFTHYYRTGRRVYMEMGEAYLRRIADTVCVHHVNPAVKVSRKPGANNQLGTGHRHDMTAWHAFCSGYSMATFGCVDFYYLTGDERIRENMEIYAYRCDADGIGAGYGGAHFTSSLVRIWEATGNPKWKAAFEKRLANPKILAMFDSRVRGGGFRSPSDFYPHLIMQEQILNHKPSADKLIIGADVRTRVMSEELYAWGYHRTKDKKYLEKIRKSLIKWEKKLAASAKLGDPWKMNWQELRKAINKLPIWYVKVYINSQMLGRYPAIMAALNEAGMTELSAIDPMKALPYLGPVKAPGLIKAGEPYHLSGIAFFPKDATKAIDAKLYFRAKGTGAMKSVALKKGEKNRYAGDVPPAVTKGAFEYYVEFQEAGQKVVRQPIKGADAPTLVEPDVNPPSKVAALKTTLNKDYEVRLGWGAATDDKGVKGYRIFQGTAPGFELKPSAMIKEVSDKELAYANKKPASGKKTVYAVQALDIAGRTGAASYLEVLVPANQAPANSLKMTLAPGSRAVALAWSGSLEPDVVKLEILRGAGADGKMEALHVLDPNVVKQYLDKGLEPGKAYRYAFKLVDREGMASPLSKPAASAALGFVRRINCGGTLVKSPDGVDWEADRKRRGSTGLYRTKAAIKGVSKELQAVYQSERWANAEIAYAFKVGAGTYQLVLHFAETNKSFAAKGKRIFDVNVNGTVIRKGLDVFTEAGGLNVGWKFKHELKVEDAGLTVRLIKTKLGPALKAIEVMEVLTKPTTEKK